MPERRLTALTLLSACALAAACGQAPSAEQKPIAFPVLSGPYLGQAPPPLGQPAIFAPGIVSTGAVERDLAMTPDGHEIYFGVIGPGRSVSSIAYTRLVNGAWSEPVIAPHMDDPRYHNIEPAISPDGTRMFFASNRPRDGATKPVDYDIWVLERNESGWSAPRNVGAPVNTPGDEFFPSVARNGTLYYTGRDGGSAEAIFRARPSGSGGYEKPERLPAQVNAGSQRFNAFVDPDERYLIVPMVGLKDSIGGCDYYVVFRQPDDTWEEPVNLGPQVNTEGSGEYSASVSPDGKYLFFMSSRPPSPSDMPNVLTLNFLRGMETRPGTGNADIYWIEAGVIDRLRAARTKTQTRP